jgi:ABC-type polysaccharide/polyol phosphate transport system ATPase subunit
MKGDGMAANEHEEEDVEINDDEMTEDTDIVFFSNDAEEILRLCDSGDIFVHGRLAENDKEVVDSLREFLKKSGYIG